jgi:ATP-binding cassette subfamily B multidrug efflux pump
MSGPTGSRPTGPAAAGPGGATASAGAGGPAGAGARRPPPRGMGGGGPFGGPGLPPEKAKDFKGSFGRLAGTLRPEASWIMIVVLLAVLSVTCSVVGPKILGTATDILFDGVVGKQLPADLTKQQVIDGLRAAGDTRQADLISGMDLTPGVGVDFTALRNVLLFVAAIYVLSSAFAWGQSYVMAGVSQRTVYRMRRDVDAKLSRLPLSYFDTHPRGDTLSRVTNDIDNIANSLQQTLTQLITALCTIIGVLAMMLWISPILAIISLLTVPLSIFVTVLIAKRSQQEFATQWARTGTLNGHVEEMHTGHSIVKAFGRQREAIERFDDENEQLFQASYRAQFLSGTIQPAMQFIANINYVLICVIGGIQVASGQMSLGDVQAFVQYSRQFTMPITQTASIANVVQSAVASAERVFQLLDEPEESPDVAYAGIRRQVQGRVELEHVSFRYLPDVPLIDDLNLVVEPGQTVAIVGPTGAGKTTLVNLLMRFYEVDAGRIAVDGIDSREMSRDELRSTFGMVLQDTWLFHGTIRENIAYGRDDATDEEIDAAAQAAHVDHFVRTLPDGYDTILDDDATSVSQGEKQLLTIARAFLADRRILILDEATSSVDTRTEVLIQKAMAKLMQGRTSFVIAHRLSTIRDADTILVMNHGKIVEQGTHEELLAKGGFYFDLYDSQFAEPLLEAS